VIGTRYCLRWHLVGERVDGVNGQSPVDGQPHLYAPGVLGALEGLSSVVRMHSCRWRAALKIDPLLCVNVARVVSFAPADGWPGLGSDCSWRRPRPLRLRDSAFPRLAINRLWGTCNEASSLGTNRPPPVTKARSILRQLQGRCCCRAIFSSRGPQRRHRLRKIATNYIASAPGRNPARVIKAHERARCAARLQADRCNQIDTIGLWRAGPLAPLVPSCGRGRQPPAAAAPSERLGRAG
jgi:hypothetical protein